MEPILEFIGIIATECQNCDRAFVTCGEKFIINSEVVKKGFCLKYWEEEHEYEGDDGEMCVETEWCCYKTIPPGSEAVLTIKERQMWGTCQQPEMRVPDKMPKPNTYSQQYYHHQYRENEGARERAKEHNAYVRQMNKEYDREDAKERKEVETYRNAMPLAEYKALLADFILTGEKPRIKRANTGVVSFDTDKKKIRDMVNAQCSLGMKEADVRKKIEIPLREGFYIEEDLLKAVMNM